MQRTPYWLERSKCRRIFSCKSRPSWWTIVESISSAIDHHTEVYGIDQPLGALLFCSSCFQYRFKSCSVILLAFASSSDHGCCISDFACCLTASSATWGCDGSVGVTGTCSAWAVSVEGFSGTIEVTGSRLFCFWG